LREGDDAEDLEVEVVEVGAELRSEGGGEGGQFAFKRLELRGD
jgi:hypothetical protein